MKAFRCDWCGRFFDGASDCSFTYPYYLTPYHSFIDQATELSGIEVSLEVSIKILTREGYRPAELCENCLRHIVEINKKGGQA